MTPPNYPQQPGPYPPPPGGGGRPPQYGPPPGQQPPPPQYGPPPGQQPPPYTPPGGQPQYGPPPGQQPPPPQYGPPPGQQPPPYTPPGGQPQSSVPPPAYPDAPEGPPQKRGRNKFVLIGIGLVVVVGIVAAVLYFNRNDASNAEVGDCIKVNSVGAGGQDADINKVDCGAAEAVFKVGKKLDNSSGNCPEGDYVPYTQSSSKGSDFSLCLMLNAKQGDCFGNLDTTDKTARVDCGAAQLEILQVIPGNADKEACANVEGANLPLVYTEPATAICGKLKQ